MRNTDLLLYPFVDMGMQPRQKRKALLYAGIGFVLMGVVSMVLTYMLLYWSNSIRDDGPNNAEGLRQRVIKLSMSMDDAVPPCFTPYLFLPQKHHSNNNHNHHMKEG